MMELSRGRVLVVALHRQRPDQDAVVADRLYTAITLHGKRLKDTAGRVATSGPDKSDFLETGIPGVYFFQGSTAVLWGPYDLATFYLADDIVSILLIGSSCGASGHELVLGHLYGTDAENTEALQALLDREQRSRRMILFSRVKLNDAFLAVGGHRLRAAMAARAHRLCKRENVLCLVMDTWSSHEMGFILLGSDPAKLLELGAQIENTSFQDAWTAAPQLKTWLEQSMSYKVPAGILRRWAKGRRWNPGESAETILDNVKRRHLCLTARTQLGVHLPPSGDVLSQLPSSKYPQLRSALERAVITLQPNPSEMDGAPSSRAENASSAGHIRATPANDKTATHERLLAEIKALHKDLSTSVDGQSKGKLSAHIQWLPKPGHLGTVQRAAVDLLSALGMTKESPRLGTGGRNTTISLRVEVPSTQAGCMLLYAVTFWLRIDRNLAIHVADTLTTVELTPGKDEPPPSAARTLSDPPPSMDASRLEGARGYHLLEYPRTELSSRFEWRKLRRLGLGTAQALALQTLFATVQHTMGQPEMFGSMLHVSRICTQMAADMLYRDNVQNRYLSEDISLLTGYAQQAYQQRLQFSVALDGGPAITGEVPHGISQLIEVANGVATVIMGLAGCASGSEPAPGETSQPPIVLLSPDAAVQVRFIRRFGVFQLTSSQAMTPMSAYLLYHELGHLIVRSWENAGDGQAPPEPPSTTEKKPLDIRDHGRKEAIRQLGQDVAASVATQLDPDKKWSEERRSKHAERVSVFLENIIAHAAWRILGCDNDLSLFRTEFLSAPAMGIRTDAPLQEWKAVCEHWAIDTLHLFVQESLRAHHESLSAFVESINEATMSDLSARMSYTAGEVLPFAYAQFECVAQRSKLIQNATWNQLGGEGDTISEEGTSDEAYQRVLKELHLEMKQQATLLLTLYDYLPQVRDIIDDILTSFVALRTQLAEKHSELTSAYPAYADVRSAVRSGRSPAPPPWTVLDGRGEPNYFAFLWVRAILSGVADHFADACSSRTRHGVIRDGDNASCVERMKAGIYTDHMGGLYRIGREARDTCLKVHATALDALREVSHRVQASRIDYYFKHQRAFLRHKADYEVDVTCKGVRFSCKVVDSTPMGLGLQVDDTAKARLASTPSLKREDALVIHIHGMDDVPCKVKWWEPAMNRLGLARDDDEPPTKVHWARGADQ